VRLLQVGIHAENLDRAEAFYRRLLGGPPIGRFEPPGLLFFDLDGTRLLLDLGAPASLLYLQVDDIQATIEGLRADGVHIEHEPHFIYQHADDTLGPSGMQEWHAFVRDTEGNLVGLVSYLNSATDR
jgi:methylmalonyl-CoA/ethylmalonyl-CoA epimerase